ncbi:coenzyme F420-0:L-glutamate ligase [bacterium]|jgi:coenzyme F420-0:L-glutamate ligase / coenzyme F420-1:gamma-L-glutamate ligase|nr:coenzyme F420-0:L-glutamate ligase [bacterium]MBT3850386.1 coenzyme F420-0:L-glutamate ligase [bacterium]MDG2445785.1 coenzyme F420-0:L-glutamate ligase [Thermodesulfobacteriota bacterium]
MMMKINLIAVKNFPVIKPGDNISKEILTSIAKQRLKLLPEDIIVIAHKIVSISQGRFVDLSKVRISKKAIQLSKRTGKDRSFCQLVLENSKDIIKASKNVIITRDKLGLVAANAGIDQSNIKYKNTALLLPKNPNLSAKKISLAISNSFDKNLPVIIADSVGRPWRYGLTQISIGSYGIKPLKSYKKDLYNNPLYETEVPIVDELASTAGLLMEKDVGIPVVLIRGYNYLRSKENSNLLLRSKNNDIFK